MLAAIGLSKLSFLPASEYFGLGFWKYLGANLIFLNFLAPSLPGVFVSNATSFVNGALWTLKIEVAFYLLVPGIHSLCRRFGTKIVIATIFFLSCLWKYGFGILAQMDYSRHMNSLESSRNIYSQLEVQFPAQLMYFSAGILLLLYFDKLKHHFVMISILTIGLFALDQWVTRDILDVLWISGFVFVVGFWRCLGAFSKHGDFSYGVYIVHWPILQVLIALGATQLPAPVFLLLSLSCIGLAAFLMWHLVEKKFLATSSHYRRISMDSRASAANGHPS
jgi:peptidoglycan/LPS O-acetylase OafA/YrhL